MLHESGTPSSPEEGREASSADERRRATTDDRRRRLPVGSCRSFSPMATCSGHPQSNYPNAFCTLFRTKGRNCFLFCKKGRQTANISRSRCWSDVETLLEGDTFSDLWVSLGVEIGLRIFVLCANMRALFCRPRAFAECCFRSYRAHRYHISVNICSYKGLMKVYVKSVLQMVCLRKTVLYFIFASECYVNGNLF